MKRFIGVFNDLTQIFKRADVHDLGVEILASKNTLHLSAAMYYPLTTLGHGCIYTF